MVCAGEAFVLSNFWWRETRWTSSPLYRDVTIAIELDPSITSAEPIAASVFSIPPFSEPGFRRCFDTIFRDSCARPKGAGSHQRGRSDEDDLRCVRVQSRTNMLHGI